MSSYPLIVRKASGLLARDRYETHNLGVVSFSLARWPNKILTAFRSSDRKGARYNQIIPISIFWNTKADENISFYTTDNNASFVDKIEGLVENRVWFGVIKILINVKFRLDGCFRSIAWNVASALEERSTNETMEKILFW